jgi:hypothetical protein
MLIIVLTTDYSCNDNFFEKGNVRIIKFNFHRKIPPKLYVVCDTCTKGYNGGIARKVILHIVLLL